MCKFRSKDNFIRFRRWSRKNYAIFAGLKKVISIGNIAVGICEKSLQKSKKLVKNTFDVISLKEETGEDETAGISHDICMTQVEPSALNAVSITVPSSDYLLKNYINHQKRLSLS